MDTIFPLKHTFTTKYMITYAQVHTWILHTEQVHEKEFNFMLQEKALACSPASFLHALVEL